MGAPAIRRAVQITNLLGNCIAADDGGREHVPG